MDSVKNNQPKELGQTLVLLLIFIVVALTVMATTVSVIITNTQNASITEQSNNAVYIAESGIENATLRLLRDPSYTGETLSIDNGSAQVTVYGSDPYIVTSIGKSGLYIHTLQATIGYTDNILTILSWEEVN